LDTEFIKPIFRRKVVPALSLRSGRATVLAALLASVLGILLLAPAALGGQFPADDAYCPIAGCSDGSDPNPDRGSPSGGGPDSGANGGSNAGEPSLGPDPSVSPAGGEGASGGESVGGGSDLSTDGGSSVGGGSDLSTDGGSSDRGSSSNSADDKASKSLNGRSLGEVLSGGTERVASAKPAARAAKAVNEDGGGAGLLWLLLALGAVTAVAAGGVAVRRRQARQGYLR